VASARPGHRDAAEPPGSPEAKVVLEPTYFYDGLGKIYVDIFRAVMGDVVDGVDLFSSPLLTFPSQTYQQPTEVRGPPRRCPGGECWRPPRLRLHASDHGAETPVASLTPRPRGEHRFLEWGWTTPLGPLHWD
jgi:hypothetical protein